MADRRLSRVPMRVQWAATIDLAVALAEGRAAWTKDVIHATGEERWYWPSSSIPIYASRPQDPSAYSGYWYVSLRIARRVRLLVEAATLTALRAGNGSCSSSCIDSDVARVLMRWRRSGRWQRRIPSTLARRDDVGPAERAVLHQDQYVARATPQWGSAEPTTKAITATRTAP